MLRPIGAFGVGLRGCLDNYCVNKAVPIIRDWLMVLLRRPCFLGLLAQPAIRLPNGRQVQFPRR